MKTIKQVLGEFARLQRKYVDISGFVDLKTYKDKSGESRFWAVELVVTFFEDHDISWREKLEWVHFSGQSEYDDMVNERQIEEFVKKMEERLG